MIYLVFLSQDISYAAAVNRITATEISAFCAPPILQSWYDFTASMAIAHPLLCNIKATSIKNSSNAVAVTNVVGKANQHVKLCLADLGLHALLHLLFSR